MSVTDIKKYSFEALRKDNERQEHLIDQYRNLEVKQRAVIDSQLLRIKELQKQKSIIEAALRRYQEIEEDRLR